MNKLKEVIDWLKANLELSPDCLENEALIRDAKLLLTRIGELDHKNKDN